MIFERPEWRAAATIRELTEVCSVTIDSENFGDDNGQHILCPVCGSDNAHITGDPFVPDVNVGYNYGCTLTPMACEGEEHPFFLGVGSHKGNCYIFILRNLVAPPSDLQEEIRHSPCLGHKNPVKDVLDDFTENFGKDYVRKNKAEIRNTTLWCMSSNRRSDSVQAVPQAPTQPTGERK